MIFPLRKLKGFRALKRPYLKPFNFPQNPAIILSYSDLTPTQVTHLNFNLKEYESSSRISYFKFNYRKKL